MHSKMADGSIRFIRQVPMYRDNHPVGCFSPYDSGNPRIVPIFIVSIFIPSISIMVPPLIMYMHIKYLT